MLLVHLLFVALAPISVTPSSPEIVLGGPTGQTVLLQLEISDREPKAPADVPVDPDLVAMALQTRLPNVRVLTERQCPPGAWRLQLVPQRASASVELYLDAPDGRQVASERVPLPIATPAATARMLALLAIGLLSPSVPGLTADVPLPQVPTTLPVLPQAVPAPPSFTMEVGLRAAWLATLPTRAATPGLALELRFLRGAAFAEADVGGDPRAQHRQRGELRAQIRSVNASLGAGGRFACEPLLCFASAGVALRESWIQVRGPATTLQSATYLDPGVTLSVGSAVPLFGGYVGVRLTGTRYLWWERFSVAGQRIYNLGHSALGGALNLSLPLPQ